MPWTDSVPNRAPADQMSSSGFNCTHISYLPGYAPMVECVYLDSGLGSDLPDLSSSTPIKYKSNESMILGAHFDSRGVRSHLPPPSNLAVAEPFAWSATVLWVPDGAWCGR